MNELEEFRTMKDDFYAQDPQSPLTESQKRSFKGLNYFPPNPELRLEVQVEEFPDKQTIQMQTNTGDIQEYLRFGRFHFTIQGQPAELTVYYSDGSYFLPFCG